ncbi:MAG: DUF1848 domain-containing protein, partial [Alphaproteobacteria bacterium]|nr:DUF1848 domain-containing protein [Alphaproteobacteria bacterium]
MIVSASYRTDIPAFYAEWFARRLAAGYCDVANPYGGKPYRVALDDSTVDGFVFWTRNIGPLLPVLPRLTAPFVVHYTLTGYPRLLEISTIAAARAVAQMSDLAGVYGPRAVVWRYDPVLFTEELTPAWHLDNFQALAVALRGAVDEVVVSIANAYRKTARNLDRAARDHGFSWRIPEPGESTLLLAGMRDRAAAMGMQLTLCSQPERLIGGVGAAACIDATRLSDVAGRDITARVKGNRPGCLCAESRDIGAYDTCPHR